MMLCTTLSLCIAQMALAGAAAIGALDDAGGGADVVARGVVWESRAAMERGGSCMLRHGSATMTQSQSHCGRALVWCEESELRSLPASQVTAKLLADFFSASPPVRVLSASSCTDAELAVMARLPSAFEVSEIALSGTPLTSGIAIATIASMFGTTGSLRVLR